MFVYVVEGFDVNICFVDCVGYIVFGVKGYEDENGLRMINILWYEELIFFYEAVEIGMRKVIQEYFIIGVVIMIDGLIGDIVWGDYVEVEERVIDELKEVGKLFIMVINLVKLYYLEIEVFRVELSVKYDIFVFVMSVESMWEIDVLSVFREVFYEFFVLEVNVNFLSWVMVLKENYWFRESYQELVKEIVKDIKCLCDVDWVVGYFSEFEFIESVGLVGIEFGQGVVEIDLYVLDYLYDQILKEVVGVEICGKDYLFELMQDFVYVKKEYDQVLDVLKMVKQIGYGIVVLVLMDMSFDELEIIRQGLRFGVRLKVVVLFIYMIKVDVESEFVLIIGMEK